MSACLCICPPICLSVYLSIYLPVGHYHTICLILVSGLCLYNQWLERQYKCLPVYLSVCLSVYLSAYLSIYLSVTTVLYVLFWCSVCVYITSAWRGHISVYLSAYLSICLPINLSIYRPLSYSISFAYVIVQSVSI